LVTVAALAVNAAPADWPDGELTIELSQAAATPGGSPTLNAPAALADLVVEVSRHDGQWQRDVYGRTPALARAVHYGRLMEIAADSNSVRLALHLQINAPGYAAADEAFYALALTRRGDALIGDHKGRAGPRPCQGPARAEMRPAAVPPPAFTLPAIGQHPRLLFQTNALDAIRAHALTAPGQAAVRRIQALADDPLALAVLHALTGEASFADRAAQTIEWVGAAARSPDAVTCLNRALAFDTIYPTLAPARRATLAARIRRDGVALLVEHSRAPGAAGNAQTRALAALAGAYAALAATWDVPGATPPELARPVSRSIIAPLDVPVDETVPVAGLRPELTPPRWLFAGPFAVRPDCRDHLTYQDGAGGFRADGFDFLTDLGGASAARPTAGLPVRYRGRAHVFASLPREAIRITDDGIAVALDTALGGLPCAVGYLYCVLKNPRDTWYQLLLTPPRPEADAATADAPPSEQRAETDAVVHLNGVALHHLDVVRLSPGPYPLLIRVTSCQEGAVLAPRFVPMTEAEAQREVQAREVRYGLARRAFPSRNGEDGARPWFAMADRLARWEAGRWRADRTAAERTDLAAAQYLALGYRHNAGQSLATDALTETPADAILELLLGALSASGPKP
jgi:hypothetical protein